MSTCQDCGEAIRWATAAHTGRRVAVDAEATPCGEFALEVALGAERMYLAARPLGAIERMGNEGHRAHAKTCAGIRELAS